ncbi:MAG: SufD family Fe-S cluster assembly protein [Candidatus Margulisiibacteriota bacterium]
MTITIDKLFELQQLTGPSEKDEDWLYYDINKLTSQNYKTNIESKEKQISYDFYIYFLNGKLINHKLPDNVTITHHKISPRKTKNNFIHLAIANSESYKIKFIENSNPIHLIYESTSETFTSHSIEIECSEHTSNEIQRHFISQNNACLTSYMNVILNKNSKITVCDFNENNQGKILDFVDGSLDENCNFFSINQTYLSHNSRFQNRIFINGENSNATLHGLAINERKQACYYNTHIYHDTENSESHQLFKSMVKEDAILEYNGKVTVCPKAQLTNSYQLNQNILLDEYANVYSRPQLFIDADDVRCTHGSTTGDINEHEVLYLMSRGLDRLSSRKIVLNGFIEEIFNKEEFQKHQKNIHSILNQIL